eukprot:scaffold139907_cov28-Tisochrysis_lutea.AAC.2
MLSLSPFCNCTHLTCARVRAHRQIQARHACLYLQHLHLKSSACVWWHSTHTHCTHLSRAQVCVHRHQGGVDGLCRRPWNLASLQHEQSDSLLVQSAQPGVHLCQEHDCKQKGRRESMQDCQRPCEAQTAMHKWRAHIQ